MRSSHDFIYLKSFFFFLCKSVGCRVKIGIVGRCYLAATLPFSGLLVAHACTRTNNVGAPCAGRHSQSGNTCKCLLVCLKQARRSGTSGRSLNFVNGSGDVIKDLLDECVSSILLFSTT